MSVLLTERQMSKRQLGKRLAAERGIAESTARSSIYKWLRDGNTISEENDFALCRIFGIPPGHFLGAPTPDLLAEIKATLEGFEIAIARQLKSQADLLATLTAVAAEIANGVHRPGETAAPPRP